MDTEPLAYEDLYRYGQSCDCDAPSWTWDEIVSAVEDVRRLTGELAAARADLKEAEQELGKVWGIQAELATLRADNERLRKAMRGIRDAETVGPEYVVKLWVPFPAWREFCAARDATPATGETP